MKFNTHSELKGMHAFLSASQYTWLNYSKEKLIQRYKTNQAKEIGTRLHNFAEEAINLGIKLQSSKKTLNKFINDAIGYGMNSEVILYYSPVCFGTADAISFKGNMLRIHDLKTGVGPTKMEQLKIYAALFCLEYNQNPNDIKMELRIYQNDEINMEVPEPEEILDIMAKIMDFSGVVLLEMGK